MKLWGGRFTEELNSDAFDFSTSINFDINLIEEDILVNKAHVKMLNGMGIISSDELSKINSGLDQLKIEFIENRWNPFGKYEDVHSAIEGRLGELIGKEIAAKIHTGRSRNDQIATDIKLWLRKSTSKIIAQITGLQKQFVELADLHTETIIPGYTHLQRAQPISLAFHLLAYYEMLERDKARFEFTLSQCGLSPLGSGALAGSTLELDRQSTAKELGFEGITANALDTSSDRDAVLDFLNSSAVSMMHLSRFCEELILWSSKEWNFIQIGDAYTTGSSLMPQKKNPDIAELIRGKSGRTFGNLISLLTTMKGLPLSYNRDLQEDKEPLFDSFTTLSTSLGLMTGMLPTIKFNTERFKSELDGDAIFATDIADYLVKKGIPFRDAHHITGEIIKYAEEENKKLSDLNLNEYQKFSDVIHEDILECVSIKTALQRKKTEGSPNPGMVKSTIDELKKKF